MELEHSKVFKHEVVSVKKFAAASGSVSSSAIYQAVQKNLIDYITLDGRCLIVLTDFTRQYKPNDSPRRKVPAKTKKKK